MAYKNIEDKRRYQSKWKREKYYTELNALLDEMGGACALCGQTKKLEFDHTNGWREYEVDAIGCLTRVRRYRAEYEAYKAGIGPEVRLLCKRCNLKEMNARNANKAEEVPF